ncbi:TetR/AcrR family transcriptional regulator [Nocardia sp. MW-W600-9]
MPKAARREQLLDTALALVRDHGTDGLTLVTLAEAAGVSRPIVYDHFDTRPELLLALYRRLDERHRLAAEQAVRAAPPNAKEIARVMSAAYFACATDMPELDAVSAALKGNPEVLAIQHAMLDSYRDWMAATLLPYSDRATAALRRRPRRRGNPGRRTESGHHHRRCTHSPISSSAASAPNASGDRCPGGAPR